MVDNLSNLNPLNIYIHCAKFGWSSGSEEDDFKILLMCFCYLIIIPLGKTSGLESSSSKNALCEFWLKLVRCS